MYCSAMLLRNGFPQHIKACLELTSTTNTVQHCNYKECNQEELFSKRSRIKVDLLRRKHEMTAAHIITAD